MSLSSPLVEVGAITHDLRGGLVRINYAELVRLLRLRGKPPAALREGGVALDTIAKIKRGEMVQNRIVEKISVQLGKWPVLEHAAGLIESPE